MTRQQIQRLITKNEFARFLRYVRRTKHKVIFLLCAYLGLRISECLRLNLNDINLDQKYLIVQKQKNKRDGERIYLWHHPFRVLNMYINRNLEDIKENNGWLFVSQKDSKKPISRSSVETVFYLARLRSGLVESYGMSTNKKVKHRFTIHSLRHLYINEMAKLMTQKIGYIDETSLQALTRHKSKLSLEPYLKINLEMKKNIHNMLLSHPERKEDVRTSRLGRGDLRC